MCGLAEADTNGEAHACAHRASYLLDVSFKRRRRLERRAPVMRRAGLEPNISSSHDGVPSLSS